MHDHICMRWKSSTGIALHKLSVYDTKKHAALIQSKSYMDHHI